MALRLWPVLAGLALLACLPTVSAAETRAYAYCDDVSGPEHECGASAHSHTRGCESILPGSPVVAGIWLGLCLPEPGSGDAGAGVLVGGVDPCLSPEGGDYCWGVNVRTEPESSTTCEGIRVTATVEWWLGRDPQTSQCVDRRIT